jgi:hypothetical protein
MTWTRLNDTFGTDPRLLECTRDARLVHVEALVYCNQHLTDGVLPYGALVRITDSPDPEGAVAQLVASGMWEPIPGRAAWQVDWDDQEPAEVVQDRRTRNAARQARFRDRRDRHADGDHTRCDTRFCAAAGAKTADPDEPDSTVIHRRNALRNASRNGVRNATPSRPVPSPNRDRDSGGAVAGQNGPPPPAPQDAAPTCAVCSRAETECRQAAAMSGDPHTFTTRDDLTAVLDSLRDGEADEAEAKTQRRRAAPNVAAFEPFRSRRGAS